MTDLTKAQQAELAAEATAVAATPEPPDTFRTYHKRLDDDPAASAAALAEGMTALALGAVIRAIDGDELRGLADDLTTPENDGRTLRDWRKARPNLAGYDDATARAILRYVAAAAPVYFPDRPEPVVEG